jgi:hypothetical protein
MNSPQVGNRAIRSGDILVEKDTLLPVPFRLEGNSTGDGWSRVVDNAQVTNLESSLAAAGWTFFYMAGTIRASAFGFESQSMVLAALKRVATSVKRQKCNCLQIDEIETHSFCGVPYISILAHSRHIQKSTVFCV